MEGWKVRKWDGRRLENWMVGEGYKKKVWSFIKPPSDKVDKGVLVLVNFALVTDQWSGFVRIGVLCMFAYIKYVPK